jgi:hypothetical protein
MPGKFCRTLTFAAGLAAPARTLSPRKSVVIAKA